MTGLELQQKLNIRGWRIPVIFITGHGTVSLAIAAMKAGAFDFIKKPLLREWGSSRRWQFAPERHRRTRDYRKIAVRRHHRTNLSKNAILSRIYLQRQVFSYGDMASMHRVNSLLYLR